MMMMMYPHAYIFLFFTMAARDAGHMTDLVVHPAETVVCRHTASTLPCSVMLPSIIVPSLNGSSHDALLSVCLSASLSVRSVGL